MFRIGSYVMVESSNDNDCYDNFRGHKLKVVSKANNTSQHMGYDNSMEGMYLYDLYDMDTKQDVDCSLYEYELEKY